MHRPFLGRSTQRSPRFRSHYTPPPARLVHPTAIRCFSSIPGPRTTLGRDDHTAPPVPRLTHLDDSGRASMVDVAHKDPTRRTATASGRIVIPRVAFELITQTPVEGEHEEWRDSEATPHREAEPDLRLATRTRAAQAKAKAKVRAKGDVLTVAQLAAIMGCKRTPELIPLCHPLPLSHIAVTLRPEVRHGRPRSSLSDPASSRADVDVSGDRCGDRSAPDTHANFAMDTRSDIGDEGAARDSMEGAGQEYSIVCRATVSCEGKTGVEMEALTAVSVGLLTVWDMLKAVAGREMIIRDVLVEHKAGGKSGDFVRVER